MKEYTLAMCEKIRATRPVAQIKVEAVLDICDKRVGLAVRHIWYPPVNRRFRVVVSYYG